MPHKSSALTAGGGEEKMELILLVNHIFKSWKFLEKKRKTEYIIVIIIAEFGRHQTPDSRFQTRPNQIPSTKRRQRSQLEINNFVHTNTKILNEN